MQDWSRNSMTAAIDTRSAKGVLQQLSDELAGAVERAGGSIVRVSGNGCRPPARLASDASGSTIVTASHRRAR
jgi:hypothetical protein